MVTIRLSRQGTKKRPFYRIVAAEKTAPRDGKFIELLGTYNPKNKELSIKSESYEKWLENGAQPSDAVRRVVNINKRKAS